MSKPLPLFAGIIRKVGKYRDTDTCKVIVELRQIALGGGDVNELQALEKPTLVCFRLPGMKFLEDKGESLTADWQALGLIKSNEEVSFRPGRPIMFTGVGPGKWDGQSTFEGKPLLKMITVVPESVSGKASTEIEYLKVSEMAKGAQVGANMETKVETATV